MKYNNIIVEIDDYLAFITINRPKKLNALNIETIAELHNVFRDLNKDRKIRVIVITGSENKAFVAGADISEFAHFDAKEGSKLSREGQNKLFDFIENLSKPVIAAINGFALGGGLELAMACHIRIASENAKMGLPEVTLGLIPGYGGTQRLPNLVGKGRAMEMIMTANMITAQEANVFGLVNKVVPQNELVANCEELAFKISQNSSTAITSVIQSVNAGYKDGVDGYKKEIKLFGKCFESADFVEGTTAFLAKRKPNFD